MPPSFDPYPVACGYGYDSSPYLTSDTTSYYGTNDEFPSENTE